MITGVYEQILNDLFEEKISRADADRYYIGCRDVKKKEAAKLLSMYLLSVIEPLFFGLVNSSANDEDAEDSTNDCVQRGISVANAIIKKLVDEFHVDTGNLVSAKAKILTAVIDKTRSDYPDLAGRLNDIVPMKGLANGALFTGAGIQIYSELQREISTADEIHLMVSFIKKSGLMLIFPQLKKFTEKGGHLKVITTTYMQASEYEAVMKLATLKNTEIKISYDVTNQRLHAKAYIFIRKTGFGTAYIGSSNLSNPALTSGAEWNVKIAQVEQPRMMKTVTGAFDDSWHADAYETFVDGRDNERLKAALGDKADNYIDFSTLKGLVRPFDYQQEILERLRVEREIRNRWRNLVVAATGTGKTVVAASDYKTFYETHERARLLFVAHREEILKQSIATFREVLRDYNFGELWYGGEEPTSYEYVFASKDMLNNRLDNLCLPSDYYDYIVIDEAHHVPAFSYDKILDHFRPKILLGLTATPERMDGVDITKYFDGAISAEIRLDDALNKGLLAPFCYYGITDSVDYSDVAWDRGHYVATELSRIYTYNDARTEVILASLQRYIKDIRDVRALGFCVDKEHAKYMAAKFTLCGLKADVLTSDNVEMRGILRKRLAKKEINYLFVVDMFNEGVDIPEVDTILFLRPTESLTVFIQQFGRGLRKAEGKTHVNILDYVGNSRAEFNYADRMRVVLGRTSMSVQEELEHNCPHLPWGCKILLEQKAREYILKNIKGAIHRFSARKIYELAKGFGNNFSVPLTLANFTDKCKVPLDKLYKDRTWSQLLCEIEHNDALSGLNGELRRAVFRKWLATDSYSYFSFILKLANASFKVSVYDMNEGDRNMLLMLYYDLFETAGRFSSLQEMCDNLASDAVFCEELRNLIPLLLDRCVAYEKDDNSMLPGFPLRVHGVYTKAQIQAAIGTSTLSKKSSSREGVERNRTTKVEAMYVDIIKDREEGSTTDYDDKALSPDLFQWDTQNRVRPDSPQGMAYRKSAQTMLLFVREQSKLVEDKSRTMGYSYLGRVVIDSWTDKNLGNRFQMQIIWRMIEPIPGSILHFARARSVA